MKATDFIKNVNEVPKRVLMYAPPKCGKTAAVFGLAKLGYKIVYIGLENGHLVVANEGLKMKQDDYERIEIYNIPDSDTNLVAYSAIRQVFQGKRFALCETHGRNSCRECQPNPKVPLENPMVIDPSLWDSKTIVVLDSLTQLFISIKLGILAETNVNGRMTQQGWGDVGNQMDTIISRIQQAPYHLVVLTHTQRIEDTALDANKKPVVIGVRHQPIAGSQNYSANVAKIFDTVVYGEKSKGRYNMYSDQAANPNVIVGSRSKPWTANDWKLEATPLINIFPKLP